MTTAFTIFAKKAVREYRIPFEVSGETPNAETRKALDDARRHRPQQSVQQRGRADGGAEC